MFPLQRIFIKNPSEKLSTGITWEGKSLSWFFFLFYLKCDSPYPPVEFNTSVWHEIFAGSNCDFSSDLQNKFPQTKITPEIFSNTQY